ncbi:ankyrin repeat-containing domain protein [Paraphoma chrysanthemicola]|uniref:Ankyrin repeat-containing domain protein n=1 Tax=Paraphoma chrysanthemicola TaxID=798071 RepID=A0A8K0QTR6_9PLEO|nr:ankyrin repeat-containing domain protein [Paraphoma chrysanthemicola]
MPHPHLGYAQRPDQHDTSLVPFLDACEANAVEVALHLAPGRDAGLLTFGLIRAVKAGHFELASQLLARGAQWDTFTVNYAAESFKGVKWLVESGYDVNTSLVGGSGLLSRVIGRNDETSIHYLLEKGAKPDLGPPLIAATLRTSERRPEPNSYWTLNLAAACCSPEIFASLLSYGADLNKAIPLHYAAGHGHWAADHETLPIGSRIPMLEYLTGLGLDINAMDDVIESSGYGMRPEGTPLSHAVKRHRIEEVKWLLAHGADPDKKSIYGISARDRVKRLPRDHDLVALLGEDDMTDSCLRHGDIP